MNCTRTDANGQLSFSAFTGSFLMVPSSMASFYNTKTTVETTRSGRTAYRYEGTLDIQDSDRVCPKCGKKMHVHGGHPIAVQHLNVGGSFGYLSFRRNQLECPHCGATVMQSVPFMADHHRITKELLQYTKDLLATGTYTLKQVSEITGLGKNTVKAIDLKRLQDKYTIDGQTLIKPEQTTRFLGIDEFTLHDGHRYATHIIDMLTGHILWISHGKKKQVVYDFIEHVGLEWMDNVEAVACDMNPDFQEAFEEKCPHIQPVFDYFHIVKNFNDKVVSEIRKDEQRRLYDEGNFEGARQLKRSKYILTSSRKTLQKRDWEARDGKVISKGSEMFCKEEYRRKEGYEARYDDLLKENKLLFTCDLIKETLTLAYGRVDETLMMKDIEKVMDLCEETGNVHLMWFHRLLSKHFEGIIAHATYDVSSGKIEGINNKIKTLRRQGYGYPDDDYFFLKLFDLSRAEVVRNPKSHRKSD